MSIRREQRPTLLWLAECGRLVLGFLVLAVLARLAGTETLGIYLSVVSVIALLPRLLDLGLPLAIGYFLRVNPEGLRACARLLCRHLVATLPAAALMAPALVWFPFEGAGAVTLVRTHWPQLAALIVAELVVLLGLAALLPIARFKAYMATVLLPPGLMLTGLGAHACLLAGQSPDAGALLNLFTAASVSASAFAVFAVRRAASQMPDQPLPAWPVYRFGLAAYSASTAKLLAHRFDRTYLATVLASGGYAQYSLAVSLRDMLAFPAGLYALTLRNRQIDLIGQHGNLAAARRLLWRTSAVAALGLLALAALLAPLWQHVMPLAFGHELGAAASPFTAILAFSCAPVAVMNFAWNHLYALNRPGRVSALTVGSLAIAVPVYLLCIEVAGPAMGAAFATVGWATGGALAALAWALTSLPPSSERDQGGHGE